MDITAEYKTDVLVAGAGLAGISASLEAARSGAGVILAVADRFCSGSSFYPGTWGLGMVAPVDEADKADFVDSIQEVGCGMADNRLSSILIDRTGDRINELEEMGVEFKKSAAPEEDDSLIPCFDRKHRKWYGYLFDSAKKVFYNKIKELDIGLLERVEIIKIVKKNNRVVAALGLDENNRLICIYCKAIVLATGGFGGLYKHSLNTPDINGYGQMLALEAGCELINIEFIQFIPGYIEPGYKTIFNERTFKYTVLTDSDGNDILDKYIPAHLDKQAVLEERSGHGPFSSRLKTKYVDIALFKKYPGVKVRYTEDIKNSRSLMINQYFKWLKEAKGIDYNQEIIIAPFEHAANGGIRINEKAETGVMGIYAAGEVTGGMHGADRIGGLATANALVFGKIAGRNAAQYANKVRNGLVKIEVPYFMNDRSSSGLKPDLVIEKVRELMWTSACIVRNEENLQSAIREITRLKRDFNPSREDLRKAVKADYYITFSLVLLQAMLLRRESRGSHYREDFPEQDSNYNKCLVVSRKEGNEPEYKWI